MKHYHLFITGCYQNYYDAERIAHLLEKMGYVLGTEKNADVIVAIACSVRQKPIDRIFGKVKNWRKSPYQPKIIITGCILESDKAKLNRKDKVDAIINADNITEELPKFLNQKIAPKLVSRTECTPLDLSESSALVPITFGCDNFCAYCAVPYTRGRERSRNEAAIIKEVSEKLHAGKRHIILLGQNVNSYELKTDDRAKFLITNKKACQETIPFVKLLKQIDQLPGDFTFNFTSSNPHDFHQSLVATLPKLKKWERKLHLPLQSGDDTVLKKMNRKYNSTQYLKLIADIRSELPDLPITTDIIVGFPGETDTQFTNTVNVCKQVGFTKVFAAQYSTRAETLAAKKYPDNIPIVTKKQRWETLNNLINKK